MNSAVAATARVAPTARQAPASSAPTPPGRMTENLPS
jgi:hypothetical protein